MALVLAIEPDIRQAGILKHIVRGLVAIIFALFSLTSLKLR